MSCVEFYSVSKQLGTTSILRDVELRLPENATTAIVGESGSGKSTLLQHVNGLLRPDRGEVKVMGRAIDYTRLPELRKRMGYAVQGVGLFPHLTIAENIGLMARLEGWSPEAITTRVAELVTLMGLPEDVSERYPHMLSGGQQQRSGLCRALMLDPPLLLLDEPFSGVDPITRAGIHEEFERLLQATSMSVLLVTHDLLEAAKLASYLVVMRSGRILQHGPLARVVASPAAGYVEELLASQLQ